MRVYFRSSAVYIAASTFAPLVHILKATAIVIYYIRSKWQVEPELILSLKYYQLRILASNQKWDTGLVVMAACIVLPGIRWITQYHILIFLPFLVPLCKCS